MYVMDILGPVIVAVVYISLCSLFKEPNRRSFNAIFIAGAGAAYLNGGFGVWEFVFLAVVTYCAYRGCDRTVSSVLGDSCTPVRTCSTTSTVIRSFRSSQIRRSDVPSATR
jgi:hypothetical protein